MYNYSIKLASNQRASYWQDPLESAVISCGTIHGGYARNVIADKVEIEGTVRYFEDNVKKLIKERMGTICTGIATSFGNASIDLHYEDETPVTANMDERSLEAVKKATMKIVGKDNIFEPPVQTMGGEDFSFYLKERPGAREKCPGASCLSYVYGIIPLSVQ